MLNILLVAETDTQTLRVRGAGNMIIPTELGAILHYERCSLGTTVIDRCSSGQ